MNRRRVDLSGRRAAVMAACSVVFLGVSPSAAAHSGDTLGEFATAAVDGAIGQDEYEGSCTPKIFQSSSQNNYELTFCEVNDETNDYWAIKIFELTEDANDTPLLWFDGNHDGLVASGIDGQCPFGSPVEDMFGRLGGFIDDYYCFGPPFELGGDGGSTDGASAAVYYPSPDRGWVFEFSHPLDSPDSDDYSVQTGATFGWCFTYDNVSDPTDNFGFGELQYPPKCWVDLNSEDDAVQGKALKFADVEKETKLHDQLEAIRDKLKGLVASCKFCPPDPRAKLREKINEVIRELTAADEVGAIEALEAFISTTRRLIRADKLPEGKAKKRFLVKANRSLDALKSPAPGAGPSLTGPGVHSGVFQVDPNGSAPRG